MERQLCLDGWAGKGPQHSGLVWLTVQCCFTSTEIIRTVRDGEPRTATSTVTQLLSSDTSCSVLLYVHRAIRTVRDREPRMVTTTSTQLLGSADSSFTVALRPQRP